MEANRIAQNLEGKTVLVTGGTGFLAKILVEKILRVQPDVKKLFLLVRSSNVKSVEQRLHHEVKNTELFQVLKDTWQENITSFLSSKMIPVLGDISHPNLGITIQN
ncbi:Alcohol-forming fatty acyl-CoA reductase [Handroanthus impetiginosus]|uniref:Fatty acyl-CoA reductase n=1 Tax=Handroanthus impetiginosus TaxID=429701 RepID=A0A2G9GRW3_9LAMI|nr:Alcohol-forming fatty acyl-CoA reductase [Handroanthus impetiginosus]